MRATVVNFKVQVGNMTRVVHKIAEHIHRIICGGVAQGEPNKFCSVASLLFLT